MTDTEIRDVLTGRIAGVRRRIDHACQRSRRIASEVTLVAVTKTVSPRVAGLLPDLGVLDLGESRPQELWRKAETLQHLPIHWHLIGHLQRNKVERTLPLVQLIHSVDSLRLLAAIARTTSCTPSPLRGGGGGEGIASPRQDPSPPTPRPETANTRPRVLLQVNASHEQQKHGFDADELIKAEAEIARHPVDVVGLMGMAALADDPEQARPTFAALRRLRDRLRNEWKQLGPQLTHLSVGMSGDYEVAVEEGATLVRVGTTLFAGLEAE